MYIDHNEVLSRFELEIAFRKCKLSGEETMAIVDMCKQLGKYMCLDWDMLQARIGYKLKMRYFRKAINMGLITELADDGNKKYYFSLGPGGLYLLETDGFEVNKLPLSVNHLHRGRILAFNSFALKNELVLLEPGQDFTWFACQGDKIGYFKSLIKIPEIRTHIKADDYSFFEITEHPWTVSPTVTGTVKYQSGQRVRHTSIDLDSED